MVFDLHMNFHTFIEWILNYMFLMSIGWYQCHLWKYINIYIYYFQLKWWLYVVYKWFLVDLNSLWFFLIKPDTDYHIAFYICIFLLLRSKSLKTSWDTCSYKYTFVHNENSDDITYNHLLSLLFFSFFSFSFEE